jgi:hypothetical protein
MSARRSGSRPRTMALVALASAGLAAGGCGGASKPPPAPGSPERPLRAEQPRDGGAAAAAGRANEAAKPPSGSRAAPTSPSPSRTPSTSAEPSYENLVAKQSRHPRTRFAPCNLVTEKQARTFVGAPMRAPFEAAQGPTCIYRSRDGSSFVTLAVQALDLARIKPRLRLARRVRVGGRTAYCGTYGQPMLYVPLSGGRALAVGGRCPVARRFATAAVRQL